MYFYVKIKKETLIIYLIKKKMPQLVPFYFINQVTFAFVFLIVILYVLSKYILPRFVRLFISRMFISKL